MKNHKFAMLWGCLGIAVIVLGVYWPVINNGFVWDDRLFMLNPEYVDPGSWKKVLTSSFEVSVNYYRPLVLATYIAELYLAGVQPFVSHLTNLILHIANANLVALLVWRVITSTGQSPGKREAVLAFLAGLFYGVHPVTVEATAWISGRFDLMLTFFSLLLLYLDCSIQRLPLRVVAVAACFLLAALSKEMAAAMGFVVPVWHLALRRRKVFPLNGYWNSIRTSGDLYIYLAIIGSGLLYLIIRFSALGFLYMPDSPLDIGDALQRVLLVGKSFGSYLLLVALPFVSISPIHFETFPLAAADPLAWTAMFVLAWIAGRIIVAISAGKSVAWFWGAAILALLPVINIIPLTIGDSIVHERFLQFPLAMFCIVGGISAAPKAFVKIWADRRRQYLYGFLACVIAAAYVLNVRVTVPLWRDDLTLWSWVVLKNPDSHVAVGNLANAYKGAGELELSLEYGFRAVNLSPGYATGWIIVGNTLSELGLLEKGEEYLRAGVLMRPDNALALNNLGAVLIRQGRLEEAESVLIDGLAISPKERMLNRNLGILYLKQGQKERALEHFRAAYLNLPVEELEKDVALQEKKILGGVGK